jgi:hypothetical protein
MRRTRPFLPNLPDCDDTLRRLSDVLMFPETCRKIACRKAMRCQGGYGPPCFLEHHRIFARALLEQIGHCRDHWDRERDRIEAALWERR